MKLVSYLTGSDIFSVCCFTAIRWPGDSRYQKFKAQTYREILICLHYPMHSAGHAEDLQGKIETFCHIPSYYMVISWLKPGLTSKFGVVPMDSISKQYSSTACCVCSKGSEWIKRGSLIILRDFDDSTSQYLICNAITL